MHGSLNPAGRILTVFTTQLFSLLNTRVWLARLGKQEHGIAASSVTSDTSATSSICGRRSGTVYPQKGRPKPPSTLSSWVELVADRMVRVFVGPFFDFCSHDNQLNGSGVLIMWSVMEMRLVFRWPCHLTLVVVRPISVLNKTKIRIKIIKWLSKMALQTILLISYTTVQNGALFFVMSLRS